MASPDETGMFGHIVQSVRAAPPKDYPDLSFAGKTIIVTGANTGLGLASAMKFAEQGATHLILAVRTIEKGNAAKDTIIAASKAKNPTCKIDVWQLDMLSYASIRTFATRASTELDRIDIAVLNAGIFSTKYESSEHGWENDLQVNTISTILLALLLIPKLKASRSPSLIPVLEFVGSNSHWMTKIPKDHLSAPNIIQSYNGPVGFADGVQGSEQYGRSKLFLQAATQHLGSHIGLAKDGKPLVYVWAMCPGVTKTEIARNASGFAAALAAKVLSFAAGRTPEQGARSVISGTALDVEAQGGFYRDDEVHV
jgi:NAD(P)-dependent dehydrogenase (short-subunit alcohol dehydrogenase family)